MGPFNLSINEEVGLLVDGFDTPPMVMMGHDPRYVAARVEEHGFVKAKDVYAYVCPTKTDVPSAALRRVRRGVPEGITIRQLDMKRYDEEVATLTEILNDAWAGNWGFTPTTEAETRALAKNMKPVVDPRLTLFAEIDGESAGMVVFLPSINEAIRDLKGKLLPFGWAKLLWRLEGLGPEDGPRAADGRAPPSSPAPCAARSCPSSWSTRPRPRPRAGLRDRRTVLAAGRQHADPPDRRAFGRRDLQDLPDLREGALTGFNALVLAGPVQRPRSVADYAGVAHKGLIELSGHTLLERVVTALREAGATRIGVSANDPSIMAAAAALKYESLAARPTPRRASMRAPTPWAHRSWSPRSITPCCGPRG